MVKLSILLVLALSVVFAQTVSAYKVPESDDEDEGIDAAAPYDADTKIMVDDYDEDTESEPERPTLACLVFGDFGCNMKCSIAASAFSISGSGKCTAENICQCDLQLERSFDNLFNFYFENSNYALGRIKSDSKVLMKVMKVIRKPYQTAAQVKAQLLGIVDLETFFRMYSRHQTPAEQRDMVCGPYELDKDKIKEYVSEKVTPVLKSSAGTLKGIDYKKKLSEGLKKIADDYEDLQSVMNEVRRTENRHLNGVLGVFLQLNRDIGEVASEKQDTIVDAIGYSTVDQLVNGVIQLNRPAPKKRPGSPPSKNISSNGRSKPQGKRTSEPKKSQLVGVPPREQQKPTGEVAKNEKNASAGDNSANSRFQITGIDENFASKYKSGLIKTFRTDDYTVRYKRNNRGDVDFTWKKGNDEVEMEIGTGGVWVDQKWHLDDAKILLNKNTAGYTTQTWKFGDSQYTYSSIPGSPNPRAKGKKEDIQKNLQKYKDLIAEWCNKNLFLVGGEESDCIIY